MLKPEVPVDSFLFALDNLAAQPGDIISIPVRVKDFSEITGYQFTMNWDPSLLKFKAVHAQALDGNLWN